MSQTIDSSSAPFSSSPSTSAIEAPIGHTTLSSVVAPDDRQSVDQCAQNVDLSHDCTASHIGDCNVECSYCAVRLIARRAQFQEEA